RIVPVQGGVKVRPLQLAVPFVNVVERLPDATALIDLIATEPDERAEIGVGPAAGEPLRPGSCAVADFPVAAAERLLRALNELVFRFLDVGHGSGGLRGACR